MLRIFRPLLAALSALAVTLSFPSIGSAQGVTTGGIGGVVRGPNGVAIEGATIKISDPTTGLQRITTSRSGGRYVLTGLEVADYNVSVTAIGFKPKTLNAIHVKLTSIAPADFDLEAQAVQLQEIVTTAPPTIADISPTRTGAQTYISDTLVTRLPTLGRNMADFIKLTPQVSINPAARSDLSAAGQNNRYNSIQVDGTTQNDRFGLGATGELGGQANGRGISLEAVKEYQVVLSPYNVTQGNFTGAAINAVTKNGTNDVKVTGFFTFRNQDLATNDPFIANTKFKTKQYGGSIGGPIIKDKVHFFFSGDLQSSLKPASGVYVGQTGLPSASAPRVDQATIDKFNTALALYGIDGGDGTQQNNANPITNLVGRLDVQLSPSSRLVIRDIYDKSAGDDFSRTAAVFSLTSNRFKRSENANSITAELFKTFHGGSTLEFQVGYIRQRFARSFDNLAPQITINNLPSPTVPGQLVKLVAGPDSSSHVNQLDQDFYEFRTDYSFPLMGNPNHLITLGTRDDYYKVRNAFWQNKFGSWGFQSIDSLTNGLPSSYAVGVGRGDPVARFKALNLAAYAQDQWSVSRNFTLTLGLRVDGPHFLDKPEHVDVVATDFSRNTEEVPSNLSWSPRLGFNYDVGGKGTTQVRGGVGFFDGLPPFVWLSNVYTNNGTTGVAQLTCANPTSAPVPVFNSANADPDNPPQACGNGNGVSVTNPGAINTVDPKFTQPQLIRATLGFDTKWRGYIFTVDGIYSKSLKAPFMFNLELPDPVGTDFAGRTMYGTLAGSATTVTSTIPYKHGASKYSGGAFDLENSSKDYTYSISGGVTKRFGGVWEGSAFYTYSRSYSVQDFTSSTARSNFQNGRTISGPHSDKNLLSPSAFDRPNRINGAITWTAPWKQYPTDISFIYTGQSGTTFGYVYQAGVSNSGDLNADGFNTNDLVYIPNTSSEITFEQYTGSVAGGASHAITPAEQADSLTSFLKQMPCLTAQKGHIMKRNSCSNPWFNTLDFSLRQSLPSLGGHRLTLQADIYNFLNFMNGSWGQYRQNNQFSQVNLFQHRGMTADGKPIVRFDPGLANYDVRFPKVVTANNYWQAQVTLRYAY